MTRYLVTIRSNVDRARAAKFIAAAPIGTRVELKAAKRSLPQNDLMWSRLSELALQLPWHGVKIRPDDYKMLFVNALKRESKLVPNLDGSGFVDLRTSSSDLTKSEMSDLLELMSAFAAEHGVTFKDTEVAA